MQFSASESQKDILIKKNLYIPRVIVPYPVAAASIRPITVFQLEKCRGGKKRTVI